MADLLSQFRLALDLLLEIRVADVVDIALVTTLLYTAIVLVRRTQAAFVAFGILVLGALYILARVFHLRLTAWIFQGFFAVLLVILVVIFQEELRQLFERVALWSLRRRNHAPTDLDRSEVIVRTLADLARARVGALVVLPGLQPLGRHIRGGVELDGRLSEALLKSIFDPHSAGHDGAVVIERDRVTRFGAQLRLSNDFQQLARVGTRHSAALGLAEVSDALCLVVSEERGEISVASGGRLRRLSGPSELTAVLGEFDRRTQPSAGQRRVWWELVRENGAEKLVSLAIVIGLWWLFVPGSRPATFSYEVPVRVVNLPPELELDSVEPANVKVEFSGARRAFYLFRPKRAAVTVDASLASLGRRTFQVADHSVRYPKDLILERIVPSRVRISVRPAGGTQLQTNLSGSEPAGGAGPAAPDPALPTPSAVRDESEGGGGTRR